MEFALLVVSCVEHPAACGPFTRAAVAEHFRHVQESHGPEGIAFPIALTPLAAHPLTSRAAYPRGAVVQSRKA